MMRKVVGSLADAAEQALAADSPVSGPLFAVEQASR